ncbi:MAG TPA: transcriptional repressor [Desulfobulbus sp.]|nr:transcriptional repressor [Desulfobulbus sp.]
MCKHCDYAQLLEAADLEATANRLLIMEVIGSNNSPLTAAEVFHTVERTRSINRVTVYRILDLLVEKHLLERISTGGRAAHFGMAPNEHHPSHPHFFCMNCGMMSCLSSESLTVHPENLQKTFPGRIQRIEIRVEGICNTCLKQEIKRSV